MSGFAWQGGEPTLMGLDFYKRAVELQKKYGITGQEVGNALQTNALLLNDAEWGRFLHENKFLVGISIDGPKELHDHYRLDLGGHGTWDRVMRAIDCCKEHQVEFNTLTLVNHLTADHPDEVFDFLIDLGVRYLQFIPCVEVDPQTGQIAEFSVTPKQYGDFQCRIFDRWMQFGPQRLSIRDFDSTPELSASAAIPRSAPSTASAASTSSSSTRAMSSPVTSSSSRSGDWATSWRRPSSNSRPAPRRRPSPARSRTCPANVSSAGIWRSAGAAA